MKDFNRKYRFFLCHILFVASMFLMFFTYEYYRYMIPDNICMKTDSEEQIVWNMPVSGTISAESSRVVSFQKPVTFITGSEEKNYAMDLKLFGFVPLKQVEVEVTKTKRLIPLGNPIGIYMKTQGVLVLDTGKFKNEMGKDCSPAEHILEQGDYLLAMDGVAITDKKQVKQYVERGNGAPISFQIKRKEELKEVVLTPQRYQGSVYKAGIWLRDSAQGIGTLTYMDDEMHFGALGHGINDIDVGDILQLGTGLLYQTEILSIKKGERGEPGEMTGLILYEPNQICGVISENTNLGIYGTVSPETYAAGKRQALPIAYKQDVTLGKAQILCQVEKEKKYYEIELIGLDYRNAKINQRISFQVTDPKLLELTGGIVQGMSGSPIIQNGKIIGAVTHVFVNDPTKGYGIFIENMLEN